jgi:modulator of FtsH protease HflK
MPWDSHSAEPPKGPLDRYKQILPDGLRRLSAAGSLMLAALMAIVAFYAFTFQVAPDELGVVMRFGKVVRQESPGLHFRMPFPIDEVRLPKVTRQSIIEIGLRTDAATRGTPDRISYVREEGLMLTADENIVDVSFVVYWRIQDAQKYLFNIRNPETTVKDVGESSMREVVGKMNLLPILTDGRPRIEQSVQQLMQDVLDRYSAGIRVDQIRLQKIDPPTQVIDAFRDVQAAATDREKLQNEALSYASRIVPEARGDAERILQNAKGFQLQTVAEATGQTLRFLKIQEEYAKSPGVTRSRMYLETMERVLGNAEMTIIDNNIGVRPYVSLGAPRERK